MKQPKKLLPNVKKIAVLRALGLGDFIVSLPALEALRAAYPDAEIVYLGAKWLLSFARGRKLPFDRVVGVPESRGVNDKGGCNENQLELDLFFKEMQLEKFDLAIQLHGGGRNSNPFIKKMGSRLTIGMKTQDALPLDLWIPYAVYQPEIMRYLEVVSLVGARPVSYEPQISLEREDLEEIRPCLKQEKSMALLNPCCVDSRRRWAPEKFAEVADWLLYQGMEVFLNGTADESFLCHQVVAGMKGKAIDLSGKLSLGGLLGLLSKMSLMVSNDSGPLHAAYALGTPSVGIYWFLNYIHFGPFTAERNTPVISWQMECSVCGKNNFKDSCLHGDSFVDGIGVEEVIGAASSLLERNLKRD